MKQFLLCTVQCTWHLFLFSSYFQSHSLYWVTSSHVQLAKPNLFLLHRTDLPLGRRLRRLFGARYSLTDSCSKSKTAGEQE